MASSRLPSMPSAPTMDRRRVHSAGASGVSSAPGGASAEAQTQEQTPTTTAFLDELLRSGSEDPAGERGVGGLVNRGTAAEGTRVAGGMTATPGPPTAEAAATALLAVAVENFETTARAHPADGSGAVPPEVKTAAAKLVKATASAWTAKGIAFETESPGGTPRLRVSANTKSTLGAFSRTLHRRFDEALIFDPLVLYKEKAKGSHHLVSREVFLSIAAAQAGDVTQTERHEMLHVYFHHRYQARGEETVFNGWAHPRGAGTTLFGEGANYTQGFSFEEQAASAFDAAAELRGVNAVIAQVKSTGVAREVGVTALTTMAKRLRLHLDQFAGPSLAAKSEDVARMLKAVGPSLDAATLSTLVARPSVFFGREGLSTAFTAPHAPNDTVDVELVLKELPAAKKTVVEIRLSADGLDVNLPLFDPALADLVRQALAGQAVDAPQLAQVLQGALQSRADALAAVASTQVEAWNQLKANVEALEAALAFAGPSPASPTMLVAAAKNVQKAATALRHTILTAVR